MFQAKTSKKILKTVAGVVLTAGASVLGFSCYLVAKNKKKLCQCDGQNNIMYTLNFGQVSITTESNTDNVLLAIAFSGAEIDMTKAPVVHDVTIDLLSYFSGITITVPEGVQVICDASCESSGVTNEAGSPDAENAPVVRVTGKAVCCGITICRG